MKHELELKLMASLDGELSSGEAREIAVLMEQYPEARALARELGLVRAALKDNEPSARLPESREFYWSKIERALLRPEPDAVAALSWREWLGAWRRWLAPVAGAAVMALLGLGGAMLASRGTTSPTTWTMAEVEDLSELAQSQTFRAGNMTVVWVDTKETSMARNWEPTEPPTYQ